MLKNTKLILVAACLLLSGTPQVYAMQQTQGSLIVPLTRGSFTLGEIIEACQELANATQSDLANTTVGGKMIILHGQRHQIRHFSFEDTRNILPTGTTFKEYAAQTGLLGCPSVISSPEPNIKFESFGSSITKLNDGIYFSMVLRKAPIRIAFINQTAPATMK